MSGLRTAGLTLLYTPRGSCQAHAGATAWWWEWGRLWGGSGGAGWLAGKQWGVTALSSLRCLHQGLSSNWDARPELPSPHSTRRLSLQSSPSQCPPGRAPLQENPIVGRQSRPGLGHHLSDWARITKPIFTSKFMKTAQTDLLGYSLTLADGNNPM